MQQDKRLSQSFADPLAALMWLAEAGADETIGDTAVDRFAAPPPRSSPVARPVTHPAGLSPAQAEPLRRMPVVSVSAPPPASENADAIGEAQRAATQAQTLAELRAALEAFEGCALKARAANTVFADGNPASRLMLIGEAPGRDEDRLGLPFVGRAGKLLDKMLAAIGLDRNGVYITNVINWRPPDNRDPTPEEAGTALPFLRRHIELVDPAVIVLVGAVAARHVLGVQDGIMRLRGRWLEYRLGARMVPALPILHPAYLLRQPGHKKLAWRDLCNLKEKIATLGMLEPGDKVR